MSLCEALSIYCQLRGSVKESPWGLVRLHEELCYLLQCVFWSGVLGLCREPPLSFGFGGGVRWDTGVGAGPGEGATCVGFPCCGG